MTLVIEKCKSSFLSIVPFLFQLTEFSSRLFTRLTVLHERGRRQGQCGVSVVGQSVADLRVSPQSPSDPLLVRLSALPPRGGCTPLLQRRAPGA